MEMHLLLSHLLLLIFSSSAAAWSAYAPVPVWCPSGPLVRPADGLSPDEEAYRTIRKGKADTALVAWLQKTNPGFGTGSLPTLALTSSGGGYRSLLTTAGVVQGLDARDSKVSTSGLYQALTYHAGLSGGGWMLSSMAGNNYPTITQLKETVWEDAFEDGILDPETLLKSHVYLKVLAEMAMKRVAGFDTTVVDAYGRILSYQFLKGFDGGVSTTLSSIAELSNFTSHQVPFPIITAIGAKTWENQCLPALNGTQYEFTPFEFGSWDRDVSAFTPTKYLGTSMTNGRPSNTLCRKNYDNLGYIFGTSSDVYPAIVCPQIPTPHDAFAELLDVLLELVGKVTTLARQQVYGLYKNPFYKYQSTTGGRNFSNDVAGQQELRLVDGGMTGQNNPLFPLLQPARGVDVILVNDNSANNNNYPDGSEILETYVQSLDQNLSRMPFIPSVETFLAKGLNKKAVFFGCDAPNKTTIIWLPNARFTFDSNKSTAQLMYPRDQTEKMIANGVQVATQGGDDDWGVCLGCGMMMKSGQKLPEECQACLINYCFKS